MNRSAKFAGVILIAVLISAAASAQTASPAPDASFAPFEQWMGAVLTADAATLKGLYSTDPAAQVRVKTVMHPADADTDFWLGLKVRSMKVEMVRLIVRPDKASIIFRADVAAGQPGAQAISVTALAQLRVYADRRGSLALSPTSLAPTGRSGRNNVAGREP